MCNRYFWFSLHNFCSYFRRYLDISNNHLSNIEDDSFLPLKNLTFLNLSENNLQEIALKLPNSLEHLQMTSNKLKFWPFVNRPTNLSVIEVQHNSLIEMFSRSTSSKTIEFNSLTKLNVSHNRIEHISNLFRFPNLHELDLSYNRFQNIPQYLDAQTPNLEWLRLNGNPINDIRISNKLIVQRLELSDLDLVKELDANELSSIGKFAAKVTIISFNNKKIFFRIQNRMHWAYHFPLPEVEHNSWKLSKSEKSL